METTVMMDKSSSASRLSIRILQRGKGALASVRASIKAQKYDWSLDCVHEKRLSKPELNLEKGRSEKSIDHVNGKRVSDSELKEEANTI
jgi:hypothetical protein